MEKFNDIKIWEDWGLKSFLRDGNLIVDSEFWEINFHSLDLNFFKVTTFSYHPLLNFK